MSRSEQSLGAVLMRIVRLSTWPRLERGCDTGSSLDEPGDDVHRRTLGGEHQGEMPMARAFCASVRERRFDLTLYREHQIRQLVDESARCTRRCRRCIRRERQLRWMPACVASVSRGPLSGLFSSTFC